jgi:uncharacterized protein (TIGR02246 family)
MDRESDRKAITKLTAALVASFNKADAKAMASAWTEAGEYISGAEEPIRGRAALEKAYGEFFEKNKKVQLEIKMLKVRFVGAESAIEEGTFTRKNAEGEVTATSQYNLFLVREKGDWRIAVAREDVVQEVPSLEALKWLLGEWSATLEAGNVEVSYAYDESKAFIHGKYKVKEKDKTTRTGLQIIGRDLSEGVLRVWEFDSDGGFSSGTWIKDDNRWLIEIDGITGTGDTSSATNVVTLKDNDTFVFLSTHRWLAGEPLMPGKPVQVTRVKKSK